MKMEGWTSDVWVVQVLVLVALVMEVVVELEWALPGMERGGECGGRRRESRSEAKPPFAIDRN